MKTTNTSMWIALAATALLSTACGSSVEGDGAANDGGTGDQTSAIEAYQDAVAGANVTLVQAIATVAAAYPDGTVYGGELAIDALEDDDEQGENENEGEEDDDEEGASQGATYEIEVFDGTRILEVDVHPQTGAIESAEPEDDEEDGDDEDDDEEDGLCDGGPALADAIATAEAEAGGTAVEIEGNREDCELDVLVVTTQALMEVTIGADGSVVEVEEADEHEDGDDEDDDGEDGNEDGEDES